MVRADFNVVRSDPRGGTVVWEQQLLGTPFARLLSSAETEVRLLSASPAGPAEPGERAGATEVTIELRQVLTGFFPRFGGFMVRRAAATTIDQALDGLERLHG